MRKCKPSVAGFTLLEVLIALAIVAVTLVAGMKATSLLIRSTERQADRLLAQLCVNNAITELRLSQRFPAVGDITWTCELAGRVLELRLLTQATPNPNFRRVEARLTREGMFLFQASTVIGRI